MSGAGPTDPVTVLLPLFSVSMLGSRVCHSIVIATRPAPRGAKSRSTSLDEPAHQVYGRQLAGRYHWMNPRSGGKRCAAAWTFSSCMSTSWIGTLLCAEAGS